MAAHKAGLGAAELAAWPRLGELPFDSVRKRMTTLQRQGASTVACMKGALGPVLDRCVAVRSGGQVVALDEALRRSASQVHDELASSGLRVLAVAQRAEVRADGLRWSNRSPPLLAARSIFGLWGSGPSDVWIATDPVRQQEYEDPDFYRQQAEQEERLASAC